MEFPLFPLLLILLFVTPVISIQSYDTFLNYLSFYCPNSNLSQILYSQNNSSYLYLLNSTIQNLKFSSITTPKPILIFTPNHEKQIQAAIMCAKNQGLSIRVRSGGHDYEALSYRSVLPSRFIMIDLTQLRSVYVNSSQGIAWVQSGATLDELYYEISKRKGTLAFPAGTCPTVGVGGHLSGGGFGTLLRKYGLAADNIIDAKVVVSDGRILDRGSMGEDLFWAIRGGGGGSFGVVISWKVRLVQVPKIVSVFTINRILDQGAIELTYKWQFVAPNMTKDLYLEVDIKSNMNGTEPGAVFTSLFLGKCTAMLSYMQMHFPELRLERNDCKEMSYIQSVVYFAGFENADPKQILLDRSLQHKSYYKGTSDYVIDPIPLGAWKGVFDKFRFNGKGLMNLDPHGGLMSEIPESSVPYPHRKGVLFNIQYLVAWNGNDDLTGDKYQRWIQELRNSLTPYVSMNPRRAYVNFRDLNLGRNEEGQNTSYKKARIWGEMYFKRNFHRLALIKGEVDEENFFRHEQSIPPLQSVMRAIRKIKLNNTVIAEK